MSYESKDQIFLYHGYALGAGGYIERGGQPLAIPGVGAGALSIAGGKNVNVIGPWSWAPPGEPDPAKNGFRVSVGETTTSLSTDEIDEAWITQGEVTLKDFNLCDRVKVGLIVSKLTSRHTKKGKREQARISFHGSQLWNVSVDGVTIDVAIDQPLDNFQTHRELKDVIAGKKAPEPNASFTDDQCTAWKRDFAKCKLLAAEANSPQYVIDLAKKYQSDNFTRCSIAGPVRAPKGLDHVTTAGYSMEIKDFGRIFFGEMIVADGMKRLNMVRWDLGCDNCSGGTGGTVDLNGASMP